MKRAAVIGGGPAGYTAAVRLSALGIETTLFEARKLGGVCLNYGCVPTKHLLAYAKTYKKAEGFGFECSGATVKSAVEYAKKGAEFFSNSVEKLLKSKGVRVIRSFARVKKDRTVSWDDGSEKFDFIVIATGSRPAVPDPLKGIPYLTAEDYEKFDDYKKVVIIGAGAQGIEFSSFFAMMDTEVHLVDVLERILPQIPDKYAKLYETRLKRNGINLITGTAVVEVKSGASGFDVFLNNGEALEGVDAFLVTAGRIPNTEAVEISEIKDEKGFIKVDDQFRTAVEGIYAVGDVIRTPALAYTAYAEAEAAVKTISGKPTKVDYSKLPYAVFGKPEIAWAGKLEGKEHRVQAGVSARAYAEHERDGFCVLFEKEGEVCGMLAVGIEAPEIIHYLELLPEDAGSRDFFFIHPSFSEIFGEAFFLAKGEGRHAG
jgi:dihydrolipoamide dehydrogenase